MSAFRQIARFGLVVTAAGLQATADVLRRLAGLPPEEVAREAAAQGATDAAGEDRAERTARRQAERIVRAAEQGPATAADVEETKDEARATREASPAPPPVTRPPADAGPADADEERIAALGERPVRQLLGAIPTLPSADREALLRYERSHQRRKTVIQAIERAQSRSVSP